MFLIITTCNIYSKKERKCSIFQENIVQTKLICFKNKNFLDDKAQVS